MSNGIRTTNLERSFVIDELLGNITEDGVEKTARLPIEALASQLAGTGPFVFGNTVYVLTRAQLDTYTPSNERMGGVVLTGADAGYYARSAGVWVFGRGFPDTLAKLTVTGGTANAVQASASPGVNPSLVTAFYIDIEDANTAAVTISINGAPPVPAYNFEGAQYSAGEWNGRVFLSNEGASLKALTADPAVIAAAVAATAADRVAAEAAKEAAEAAASSVSPTEFPNKAAVQALTPAADPTFLSIAGYAAPGDGGAALYKKVAIEPTHSGKIQNGNGTWYEIAATTLRPEMFGQIGISAAGDTAAWVGLVATANHRGGKLRVRITGDLNLNGTGTANDNQTFTNFSSLWIRGDDTEVYQRNSLSKTFKFIATDAKVKVTGIVFVGYAEQQIDAAITPTEINFNSSSGNAVAAIYAEDLYELDIKNIATRNHAGRDIDCRGVLHLKGRDLDLVGLGPTYNRPALDGHQGNGEDAAIYFIPKVTAVSDPVHGTYYDPVTSTAYRAVLDVCNCSIRWHSFCIRTILNKAIILHGNHFGETPGQHHVYDTDSDGHDVVGNIFESCRQVGYKMQFENLAGFSYGKAWEPTKAYVVGDIVRSVSIVWRCKTAHTSGGTFASTNWEQQERYIRRGGVWTGNTFRDCGEGVGIIESSQVHGRNIWAEGYIVTGNTFLRCNEAMYMDRCWEATVTDNNTHSCTYGFYGRSFSGVMKDNAFFDTNRQCILMIGVGKASEITENTYANYGITGTSSDTSCAVLVLPHEATTIPARSNAARIIFKDNAFQHYLKGQASDTADAPNAYLVFCTDTTTVWEIEGSTGTPTTRQFRIDGAVAYQFRNHFPSYANTAQNDKAFTANYSNDYDLEAASTVSQVRDVLGTLLAAVLKAQRVVK